MDDDEQWTSPAGLPAGRAVALDGRVRIWRDASVVLGGAPWGIVRIAAAARPFVLRLKHAGAAGLVPSPGVEHAVVDLLVPRGIVHPLPIRDHQPGNVVEVVVPAYERADLLDDCLGALRAASPEVRIIVVDDASRSERVGDVARAHGATLIRHAVNRGPAAARNTGLDAVSAPIVAFVDADCAVTPGWIDPLVIHFDDPRIAAVAPRIRPRSSSGGVLPRYEFTRSALDMGPRPELVARGAPLGYLPSAAIMIRRSAMAPLRFDEALRVGEDVDLVWRLSDAGWMVRYEPASVVTHKIRPRLLDWARRHFDYGTSAAQLDVRHPRRLAPARLSVWNLAVGLLVLARWPTRGLAVAAGLGVAGLSTGLLARTLRASSVDPAVASLVVARGLVAEAGATGHLLRREWWPLGWLALAAAPRSRLSRFAAAAMLIPIAAEWFIRRPALDPVRYVALRLMEDAAYGTGVIASAVADRRPGVLLPLVRMPGSRR
ncbi:mycofactocin biosynthesis glycosyltransferase MftF [Mycolicibacterium sp.]|uniref:mycofactocin biosynthesis glycosyltransferase MftF n=1 Tax=Mycolicibacterium sp. TaxID=2320850 RepID=UPI001A19710D|nr:mycofactocin biosynthesis glycosyltransferase MftF [Mycolicibacterium sp.]MBJ7398649.1 mycofactocin biosynthesis glycosyltransferase MftF [Mycolicibacterium sp.]